MRFARGSKTESPPLCVPIQTRPSCATATGAAGTGAAGGCVTVLNRTNPDAAFLAKIPIGDPSGLGTCDPSTQSCGGVNDAFASWQQPTEILNARFAKLVLQLNF